MKKVLIIHPYDSSTNFLCPIYSDIENKTVYEGGLNKKETIDLMKKHDQIIMLGHGCSVGLFNHSLSGFVVDDTAVDVLRQKQDNIFIWCNADKFVTRYNLNGFYTGMFISEVDEAKHCGTSASQLDVDTSNTLFASTFRHVVGESTKMMYDYTKDKYVIEGNKVVDYNNQRLYYR